MAKEKEKASGTWGFKASIGIAALIGLIGGGLFGVWDSITVIIDQSATFREIFFLALYSVALYAVIGCLGMAAIGVVTGGVIRLGRYNVNKPQLAGIFIALLILVEVFALFALDAIVGNIIDVVEVTVVCILSGVGLASLIVYVLDKGIRKEKLIAACISLFVALLVFLYGGLWVNFSLLSGGVFAKPTNLLINIVFLLLVGLLAAGLYVLSLATLQRYDPLRIKRVGYILLAVMVCAFIAISFIGPFGSKNTPAAEASAADEVRVMVDSESLREKPNILWIVMDTARADHLSSYGYYRNTTPNIDRIASEGILFENAIAAAPWTLPSHASMFTGMFPSKHGTDAEHQWLEDDFQTIAEALRSNGYETFKYSNNPAVSRNNNLSQGFDTIEITSWGRLKPGSELAKLLKINSFMREAYNFLLMDDGARRTNEVVKRWIADAHQAETPFFLFINYMEVHSPYHPPQSYAKPFLSEDMSFTEAMSVSQDWYGYIAEAVQMSADDFEVLRALYDGEFLYLDFKMGQLFDYLRELEILDNTVLIITSDHGENFGEHHLMNHQLSVYDTVLHVPLIIRYPELFEAGLRVDELVQLTDIYPTILDIVGIDRDDEGQIQGHSLLREGEGRESDFAISEYEIFDRVLERLKRKNDQLDASKFARRLKAIRTEEFKYIWASDGNDELYNIRQDPGELNNLIETEPEKAAELRARLKEWLNSFEPYRPGVAKQLP